eukprot:8347280-Alexandrium_andersonii.AAC.1
MLRRRRARAAEVRAMEPHLGGHLVDSPRARLISQRARAVALDLPLNPLELELKRVECVLDV